MLDLKSIRRLCLLASLWLALAAGWNVPAAGAKAVSEYQAKAAFVFNFTKFVEWPEEALATNAPFVIGIVGSDAFGDILDEAVKAEQVHGRPLLIKRLKRGDAVENCQILFIGRAENDQLEPLLKQASQSSILTVGEVEGDAARGVMINLLVVKDTMKMEINRQRVEQAHLQISSKLLTLAKIVEPTGSP
jgi:hypothetical protein